MPLYTGCPKFRSQGSSGLRHACPTDASNESARIDTLHAQHILDTSRQQADGQPASLLFFDLNDFKQINDTLGRAEGDRALQTFA